MLASEAVQVVLEQQKSGWRVVPVSIIFMVMNYVQFGPVRSGLEQWVANKASS
jgi:hypothetical protein